MDQPDACEVCRGPLEPRPLRGGGALLRCTRCGHLHRDLAAAPAGHRDHAYGGEATLDRARLTLTYRSLTRGLAPTRVFEIGYGRGELLRRFLDAGARVGGVDPDQLQVGVDPAVRDRGELHAGFAEELPDTGFAADLVYGIHVLEHVTDPLRTLAVARDLAAPGGAVRFLTPAGDSYPLDWFGSAWWMLEDPTHVRFFTAESLRRAAQAAGLVDVLITRPPLDSLMTEGASLVRRLSGRPRPGGVLSSRPGLAAALATTPVAAAARLGAPRLRPTLQLHARRRG